MNKNLKKYSFKIVVLLFLLIGARAAFWLSQQNQDIRQQASDGSITKNTTVDLAHPKLIGPPETASEAKIHPNLIGPPETTKEENFDSRYIGPPETIGVGGNPSPIPTPYPTPSPTPSPLPSLTPSPTPAPLSKRCESCNNSLPPSTPYSRCADELVCKFENSEVCEIVQGKGKVCTAIVGQSGKCVRPNESLDVCQDNTPISLAGDTLPNDPRIRFQRLTVNELLLPFQSIIFSKTVTLNNQDLIIEDNYGEPGYGEFFVFYPSPGLDFEILAKELDINFAGSYVKTAFYGPDKKKINNVGTGTRIQYSAPSRLPYYLVVYTFNHKQGRTEITVANRDRIYNKAYVKRIDQDMRPLHNGEKLGRKEADFFLQVPRISNINNEYINYMAQRENEIRNYSTRVKITQTCPLTQKSTSVPIGIQRMNYSELNPLRNIQLKIYPQTSAYFPPGYNYTINLEYPDPNQGWVTRFSTISQSGLAADLNNDGAVDISDYSLLVSEFMQTRESRWPRYLLADLNCDGIVDLSDYSLLISHISL